MSQYTFPDKSEVEFPAEDSISTRTITYYENADEANQALQSLVDQYGDEIITGNGVQNGPLWDKIVFYTEYYSNKIRLAIDRILYALID